MQTKRIHLERVKLAIQRRKPVSICVVCGANQVRSPLAEFLLHQWFQDQRHPQTGKKLDNVRVSSRGMRAISGEALPKNVRAMLLEHVHAQNPIYVTRRAEMFRTQDCQPPRRVLAQHHLILFLEPADRDAFINQFSEPESRAEAVRKAWTLKGLALNQEDRSDSDSNHVPDPGRLHQTGNRWQKTILRQVRNLCKLAFNRVIEPNSSTPITP
ncbi:hypothetical protein HYV43_06080 [Candidatus Micrarchaeota archaeon]|nr:hypothetical protein [Candidatus Micrarchaeota archaeon]